MGGGSILFDMFCPSTYYMCYGHRREAPVGVLAALQRLIKEDLMFLNFVYVLSFLLVCQLLRAQVRGAGGGAGGAVAAY